MLSLLIVRHVFTCCAAGFARKSYNVVGSVSSKWGFGLAKLDLAWLGLLEKLRTNHTHKEHKCVQKESWCERIDSCSGLHVSQQEGFADASKLSMVSLSLLNVGRGCKQETIGDYFRFVRRLNVPVLV